MTHPGTCGPAELEQAFRQFSQVSQHLTASYQALESRVSQLNQELAATRDERLLYLIDKERLANRLARLLAVLPGGVVVLDGDGRVQDANPAAVQLLGERLVGQLWREIIWRVFSPQPNDGHDVSLHDGRLVSIDTSSLGEAAGQILLINDVTEARRLQERLARHERLTAMGEMAASLAHQIRTPLASAMLYVSHLTQPVVETEQRQRIAEKIYSGLRHLEKLVNDMLVFTRGGTVGIELISVASLLQEVRNLAEATVLNGGCQLSVADEAPGSVLHGNREALIGALHNLITNAIQACGQGGTIHLQARTTDTGMTELLVADNGPGISTGIQERIFEPFFTTRTQGVGLGLAVVQACARAHNGNLSLQSQLGQGSTFAITLPTATDSTEPFIAELSMVSAETECRPMNGNPS